VPHASSLLHGRRLLSARRPCFIRICGSGGGSKRPAFKVGQDEQQARDTTGTS